MMKYLERPATDAGIRVKVRGAATDAPSSVAIARGQLILLGAAHVTVRPRGSHASRRFSHA